MGGNGVDARARSIRVTFTFNGRQQKKTIILNGQPLPPTPANLAYAQRLASEIKERIRLGTFSMAEYFPASGDTLQPVTVEDCITSYIEAQRIEDSTKAGYHSARRFWAAQLPGKLAKALKHSDIMKATAARPDLSGKTVNNYVSVLRDALALSVKDKLIQANPAADIEPQKHQKPPPDPFTRAEADAIVAHFAQHHPGQVANMVECWMWSGLRTSEIFGLRWDNVDLFNRTIQVSEALVDKKHKKRTKTASIRIVNLNSLAMAAIQRQRPHTQLAGGMVFMDPRFSRPWDEQSFSKGFWGRALRAIGMRYRRPYNMRHSYATAMLMAGMTPAFCARQLGHSVDVFLTIYAKWIDGEQNEREIALLEAALSPGKTSIAGDSN